MISSLIMMAARSQDEMQYDAQQGPGCEKVAHDLVALLRSRRGEIAAVWAGVIRRDMAGTGYGKRPAEEIRENNLACIDLLCELLQGADSIPPAWGDLLQVPVYLQQGPRVGEIMQAVRLWRRVLAPLVPEAFPPGTRCAPEAMLRLDTGLSLCAAVIVEFVGTRTTEYFLEQQRRTALMLEMARTASASLEIQEVLRRAAGGIASAAGAAHSSICLVDQEGNTGMLWPGAPPSSPPAVQFYGPDGQRPVHLSETTFVRRVLDEKEAVIWPDVQNDPAIGPELRALGIKSVLGVPCANDERILAVAFAVEMAAPRGFTPEQVQMAQGVANIVAPAIENARLHHKVAEMAIVEERARLAQELHDQLAQTLGAMQFYTSLAGDALARRQIPQTEACLTTLSAMLDEAHVDVRETIFNLRSMASLQVCGIAALQSYLAAYEQRYGLAVSLYADAEAAGVLVGDTGVQAFRILQEALTNVRKHGQTPRARVELERDGAWVSIRVEDEGQGFDPVAVRGQDPAGFGLQVMRERAAKLGGSLAVESQPGHGTRVVLRVPLRPAQRPA